MNAGQDAYFINRQGLLVICDGLTNGGEYEPARQLARCVAVSLAQELAKHPPPQSTEATIRDLG